MVPLDVPLAKYSLAAVLVEVRVVTVRIRVALLEGMSASVLANVKGARFPFFILSALFSAFCAVAFILFGLISRLVAIVARIAVFIMLTAIGVSPTVVAIVSASLSSVALVIVCIVTIV